MRDDGELIDEFVAALVTDAVAAAAVVGDPTNIFVSSLTDGGSTGVSSELIIYQHNSLSGFLLLVYFVGATLDVRKNDTVLAAECFLSVLYFFFGLNSFQKAVCAQKLSENGKKAQF